MSPRRLPLLALPFALAACAGRGQGTLDTSALEREIRGRGLDPSAIILPHALTDEMRRWAHARVGTHGLPEERLHRLLNAIQDPGGLEVAYEGGFTATAAEAFASRRANCLAFTALFVGLARELGLAAFYLDVDDVEKYAKEGDLVVISGHITAGYDTGPEVKILEFSAAPEGISYRHVRPIPDLTAIALFYSNRGGELLRVGKVAEARQWLETAVGLDPELARGWINLGVALRREGDLSAAEGAYRRALEVDPIAHSAYQNLAAVLRIRGREQEAAELLSLTSRLGTRNPYSFLSLGDLSLRHGRLEEARRFYRKALRLARRDAETYAAMGLWALAAGDPHEATRWLRKAQAIDQEDPRAKRLEANLARRGRIAGGA
ncbi:MAG TPA: tetratricopeptide repeat protein [Thermoanaerobaculia bacterium]|nr:tetratricopeptide repeat protein [Thermoanaerobaculia bacterium]